MIKNIIFDSGGVIVKYKNTFHPELLSKLFSIPVEGAVAIWEQNRSRVITGKITTKELLSELKVKLNSIYETEELYQRWLDSFTENTYVIDNELLDLINELKKTYKVYLLTNIFDTTAKHKSHINISSFFHRAFRSYELKLKKPDRKIFLCLLREIKSIPEESIFIDDQEKNILAARKIGMKGIVYSDINHLKKELIQHRVDIEVKKYSG